MIPKKISISCFGIAAPRMTDQFPVSLGILRVVVPKDFVDTQLEKDFKVYKNV